MDCRDRAASASKWYKSFNQDKMIAEVELYDDETGEEFTVNLPVEFVVCGLCNGKGYHVNPSIDAHGISPEEFSEDPDFAADYFSGVYNVSCYECNGLRVIPEVVEKLTEEQKKNYELLQEKMEDDASYAAECEAERRMGC